MTSEQTLTVEQIYETLLAEIKDLAARKKETTKSDHKLVLDFQAQALVRIFSQLAVTKDASIQQAFKSLELQDQLLKAAEGGKF